MNVAVNGHHKGRLKQYSDGLYDGVAAAYRAIIWFGVFP